MSKSEGDQVIDWARRNTTLIFPLAIKARKPVILQDSGQQVKIPVPVGGSLKASRFHPTAPGYLVVSQPNSDKFRATMLIDNSNFIETVKPKYESLSDRMASGGNPLYARPKKQSSPVSQPIPVASSNNGASTIGPDTDMNSANTMSSAAVLTGRAKNPQKPANLLDQVSSKPSRDERGYERSRSQLCLSGPVGPRKWVREEVCFPTFD